MTTSRRHAPSTLTPVAVTGAILLILFLAPISPPAAAQVSPVYGTPAFHLGDGKPPAGFAGMATITRRNGVAGPNWRDLFNESGWARHSRPADGPDYRALYRGSLVAFTADNEDAKPGFEPSALGPDARLVINGSVAADQDIENLLGYATRSDSGEPLLFLAVSRRAVGGTVLELELNQDFVRVGKGGWGRGLPWQIEGERLPGDLLLKLRFRGSELYAVHAFAWAAGEDGYRWSRVGYLRGEGCNDGASLCALTNAASIDAGDWSGDGLRQWAPGAFVEIGLNISSFLQSPSHFVSLQARTREDVAFAYFSKEGR